MWWRRNIKCADPNDDLKQVSGQRIDDARQVHDDNIDRWLRSDFGTTLSSQENGVLAKLIPQAYAPVVVQLTGQAVESVLHCTQSALRIRAITTPGASLAQTHEESALSSAEPLDVAQDRTVDPHSQEHCLRANPAALPFAANSVDMIIATHTLDTVADPHQVLRELHQIIQPEGHLVIVGFNPVSLWGVRRLLSAWRGQYPWTAGFMRLSRIKDWLRLLGFDITAGCLCHYGLPVAHSGIRRRFQFLESAGQRWWPGLGGVYVIVARKRDPSVTPVGMFRQRRRRLTPHLAAPVTRRALQTPENDC